jgi:replicative DNA helicase
MVRSKVDRDNRQRLALLEKQLVPSVLYYDEEEMDNFFRIFDGLTMIDEVLISGEFVKFVSLLKEFRKSSLYSSYQDALNSEDNDDKHKEILVDYINITNQNDPDSESRDNFNVWFIDASSKNVPFELTDDIVGHYTWELYKESVLSIDAKDIPFNEKLSIRPKVDSLITEKNEVLDFNDIDTVTSLEKTSEDFFSTGLNEMDDVVKPVQGNFEVIAARPGVGKTMTMLNQAVMNAKMGHKCLFVSLEMNDKSLKKRVLNHLANKDLINESKDLSGDVDIDLYKKNLQEIESQKVTQKVFDNFKVYIPNTSNAESIIANVEKFIQKQHYDMIFIDYLQILRFPNSDEWASIRIATNSLKSLAMRNMVVVVTGSQVSRDSTEKGLELTTLFGSSTIEADTDIVLALEAYSERRRGEIASVTAKVLKNREGDLESKKYMVNYATGTFQVSQ